MDIAFLHRDLNRAFSRPYILQTSFASTRSMDVSHLENSSSS